MSSCSKQEKSFVDTSDIPKFWNAYDEIVKVSDSTRQIQLIDSLYFKQGSPLLEAIRKARRYSAKEYVNDINQYPDFWKSIRAKTFTANSYAESINEGIYKLKKLYSELKPAKIYFTVGALRTGGTTLEDKVLIGSEIALGDNKVATNNFEEGYPHLIPYFKNNNPDKSICI